MSKVAYISTGSLLGPAASTSYYYPIAANITFDVLALVTTESQAKTVHKLPGTFSNLYIEVSTNDRGASTYNLRKAAADGNQTVSIGASTTGKFEDTLNTDAVSANDDWHSKLATGAGGTVFTVTVIGILFDATTDTSARIGCKALAFSTANTTRFLSPAGASNAPPSVEANANHTSRIAGTLKNFSANVTSNARTSTTSYGTRKNSAAGAQSVSVNASTTGFFEDTVNSDSIASGETYCFFITTGANLSSIVASVVTADFVTTNGQIPLCVMAGNGPTQAANATSYYGAGGIVVANATEANIAIEANVALTASLLECNISANTVSANSTLTFRKNSADGNQTVSITASTTGIFRDTVNSDTIVASDTIAYKLVSGATGTSMAVNMIGVVGNFTVAGAPTTTVSVPSQSLTLAAVAPIKNVLAFPAAQTIALTLINPTVSTASVTTVQIPAQSMSLSAVAPVKAVSFLPSAQALSVVLASPSRVVVALAPALAATAALQGITKSVSAVPSPLTLTFVLVAPVVVGSSTTTVQVPAQTVSVALVAPSVSSGSSATFNVSAFSITASLSGITHANIIAPNALALAMAQVTPSKECTRPTNAQTVASVLGGCTPTVIASPSAFLLNLVLNNPTPAFNRTVFLSPLTMLFTLEAATPTQVYKFVRIFTHNKQPKLVNKINAIRRITKNNARKNQTHSGML